jgi:predicted O-methyltransferase YrrM
LTRLVVCDLSAVPASSAGEVFVAFKSPLGSEDLARYVNETLVQETELQRRLRAETARLPSAGMQISADQGAFLAFLVKLIGARRALEIGTFTGYSALCIASALPEGGELVACDVSEAWTGIARRYWQEAGVAARITLRLLMPE